MEAEESFIRQRRNLTLASTFAMVYVLAGFHVSQYNIIGLIGHIERPEVISNFLFLLVGYFLIRYYQYLKLVSGEIKVRKTITSFCKSQTTIFINQNLSSVNLDDDAINLEKLIKEYHGSYAINPETNEREFPPSPSIILFSSYEPASGREKKKTINVYINDYIRTKIYIRSLFHLAFTSNSYLEYIFPIHYTLLSTTVVLTMRI